MSEVERLSQARRATLLWGGGMQMAEPVVDKPAGGVNVGDHSTVVIASTVSGVVGAHAVGHGATRSEGVDVGTVLALLVVAVQTLKTAAPASLEAAKPDLKQRLTTIQGVLEPLGKIADAGDKLAPAAGIAATAVGALAKYLGWG
ncbi:MAG: hypothetical protein HQL37_03175 [Alphaproteobacteria bacterium]|nr:hypothetical protein [Alphaproteobacteria bacterium]